jgi:hypothetical protein
MSCESETAETSKIYNMEPRRMEERRFRMSLKIHRREMGGVVILDLAGRITTGEPSVTVRDAVREEIDKGLKTFC